MSGVKDVFKKGWHPDKGTNLKKQVTGIFRKDDGAEEHTSHSARPLSDLRDPASFGPPPKRTTQPLPPPNLSAGSSKSRPPAPPVPSKSWSRSDNDTGEVEDTIRVEPIDPPRPYKVDTTGLQTGHLPAPPLRRAGATSDPLSPPPPYSTAVAAKPTPPRLPPRLPPRRGVADSPTAPAPALQDLQDASSHSPSSATQSPPLLNQGAVGRLGAAGISVPGFGIGGKSSSSPTAGGGSAAASPVSGLQSRFGKLGLSSGAAAGSSSPPPSEGTTLAQKQAALQTAANFKKDPGSVSLSDARSAASTMNNFRQRHGDQVASGLKTAQGFNQKYGVTDRVAASTSAGEADARSPASPAASASPLSASSAAVTGFLGKKKPAPPPPPKKKPDLSGAGGQSPSSDGAPPPVPFSTRPTF